jgi:hypothetical protein
VIRNFDIRNLVPVPGRVCRNYIPVRNLPSVLPGMGFKQDNSPHFKSIKLPNSPLNLTATGR